MGPINRQTCCRIRDSCELSLTWNFSLLYLEIHTPHALHVSQESVNTDSHKFLATFLSLLPTFSKSKEITMVLMCDKTTAPKRSVCSGACGRWMGQMKTVGTMGDKLRLNDASGWQVLAVRHKGCGNFLLNVLQWICPGVPSWKPKQIFSARLCGAAFLRSWQLAFYFAAFGKGMKSSWSRAWFRLEETFACFSSPCLSPPLPVKWKVRMYPAGDMSPHTDVSPLWLVTTPPTPQHTAKTAAKYLAKSLLPTVLPDVRWNNSSSIPP